MTNTGKSGFTACACRDCFDIAVSNDIAKPDLCGDCEEAGCEKNNGECQRVDAYGCDEAENG